MMRAPFNQMLVVLVALMLSGCMISREMSTLKRDIERHNPQLELRRNVVLNVGSGTIHMLESLARWSAVERAMLAAEFLHDIDRIKVGIYDVRLRDGAPHELRGLDRLRGDSWEAALVVRNEHELAYVLYRPHAAHIRDLYVVSLNTDQLVAVRFSGHVEHILTSVLEHREDLMQGRLP